MANFSRKVPVPGKSSQELFDKISEDIEKFLAKASMGKFDVQRDVATKSVNVKSSMLNASLVCVEGAINIEGKLGLLATPFKSKIDEGINYWLKKTFQV
ncbi:MAG: polyhydroxyalkanoic acid system family protein [Methylotenera sp.]|nr:polyhydroxyalkanoic acid system family protein [Oligoflexia bacterium]